MDLLRPVSLTDFLFLTAVGALLGATVAFRGDRFSAARGLGVPGWVLFSAFWAVTAVAYLRDARYFLGTIGLVTVVLSAYGGLLVFEARPEGRQLTAAFTVTGLVFVPYEWIEPLHRVAIDAVAALTAGGLAGLGFSPVVLTGPEGYANVIGFPGTALSHSVGIVSACTGISAIALFAGLIAATDAPLRRRIVAALGVASVVYVLNLVRTIFVAGALGGEWFSFARGPIGAVYGVTDPALVSYYVAEYVVAQVLVVLVLLGVYVLLTRAFPALQHLVDGLIGASLRDVRRLRQR